MQSLPEGWMLLRRRRPALFCHCFVISGSILYEFHFRNVDTGDVTWKVNCKICLILVLSGNCNFFSYNKTIFFSTDIGQDFKLLPVKTARRASVMPSSLPHMKLCKHISILVRGMVKWDSGMPVQLKPEFVNIYSAAYWRTCSLCSCCFRNIPRGSCEWQSGECQHREAAILVPGTTQHLQCKVESIHTDADQQRRTVSLCERQKKFQTVKHCDKCRNEYVKHFSDHNRDEK